MMETNITDTSDGSIDPNSSNSMEDISPSLLDPSLSAITAYGTVQQTITKTLYKNGSFYTSNPLQVRYEVSATYTQDYTTLPGEPPKITNKNLTSWSQGDVIQTGGYPYRRLTSYYSGVSKYNNTTLRQTGGLTCDNYQGVTVGGYEVYIFLGTSSGSFSLYHTI